MGKKLSGWKIAFRLVIGIAVFLAVPEGARWLNGGAFAQQALDSLQNTAIGTVILGHQDFSATGSPGQTGSVTGGESKLTICPGQNSPQNAIGTLVGPDAHLTATANGNGQNGAVTGYSSTLTVGGPGCK